jgi:hypothetical protein
VENFLKNFFYSLQPAPVMTLPESGKQRRRPAEGEAG